MISINTTLPNQIYQLRVLLKGSKPPIWRRVHVPGSCTLARLHHVIQAVMPWWDCHLHEFHVGDLRYGPPNPEFEGGVRSERACRVAKAFEGRRRITYIYDFGDGWIHDVFLEKTLFPDRRERYPVCVAGRNACPPEDSGALAGYYRKLDVLEDPDATEHDEILEWMPPNWDPGFFDIDAANDELDDIGA
jgi:hypothetical protein